MAAITAGVITAGTALYSANRQSSAAKKAASAQRQGVQAGIDATNDATQRAVPQLQHATSFAANNIEQGYERGRDALTTGFDDARLQLRAGRALSNNRISDLADSSGQFLNERDNLLGLNGQDSFDQSLSRISDPLAAEQEQAILRNSAALGGVSGNVLSELADQTRRRTEANIQNRIGMLGNAASPGLNALQQLAQNDTNYAQQQAQLAASQGQQLNASNVNERTAVGQTGLQGAQAAANAYLGQGSQLAQLQQNAGNANAGYHAFQAQQTPAVVQGLTAGLGAYQGMGGGFGGIPGGAMPPPSNPGATSAGYTGNAMQQWLRNNG